MTAQRSTALRQPLKSDGGGGIFDKKAQFELRRKTLIAEAARVFNKQGFANASLDDISANLHITKPALYHYFKSKDELLFECFVMSFDFADEAVTYANKNGTNGCEKIQLYIKRHLQIGLSEEFPTITAREQDVLSAEYSERITQRRRKRRNQLRRFIEEGIKDGSIQPIDPKIAIMIVNGAISWLFRVFVPGQPFSAEDISDHYVQILVNGMATRKGETKTNPRKRKEA